MTEYKYKTYGSNILTLVLAIVFAVILFIHFDININHYNAQMDADIASDTLLGPVLYNNGYITPKTWYGSTEVCIISAPNIAAFIYPLTGYNTNLSMGIACNILVALLFITMFIYYRKLKLTWLEAFTAAIIILSLSAIETENQSILFLWAAYYTSHLITLYLISIFYTICLEKNKVPVVIFIAGVALSFVNSLQGMHAALFCYVPLLGVELLRRFLIIIKTRKLGSNLITLLWLFIITVISVIGADLVQSYNLGASRNIRHAGEKFTNYVWPYLGQVINYKLFPVLVYAVILLGIIGYAFLAKRLITEDGARSGEDIYLVRWSALSHIISLLVCVFSTTFTTAEAAPRYYIMEIFIVAVGTALFMSETRKTFGNYISVLVIVLGILASKYYYQGLIVNDPTSSRSEYAVAEWMQENGYKYGYATFDFANTITVMSNDSVKVRALNSFNEMEGCKWLTDSRWYPPTKDTTGKTCYIVTEHTEGDFVNWLKNNGVSVDRKEQVGFFIIYVLDHDYTLWTR